jgi:hypothetical protein
MVETRSRSVRRECVFLYGKERKGKKRRKIENEKNGGE